MEVPSLRPSELLLRGRTPARGCCLNTVHFSIWLLVLVGGSMATKDLFYVTSEFLVSRSRPILASFFDILGDVSSLLTLGVGGVSVVQFGLSWPTWLIFLAIAIGSFLGTYGGVKTGQVLNCEVQLPQGWFFRGLHRLVVRLQKPEPPKAGLTPEERRALTQKDSTGTSAFERLRCNECGGVHTRACPRVKSISHSPGGERKVEYFEWGQWPTDQVTWPEDVFEDDPVDSAQSR